MDCPATQGVAFVGAFAEPQLASTKGHRPSNGPHRRAKRPTTPTEVLFPSKARGGLVLWFFRVPRKTASCELFTKYEGMLEGEPMTVYRARAWLTGKTYPRSSLCK